MAHTIKFDEDKNYIEIVYQGELELFGRLDSINECIAHCRAHKTNRVLIDVCNAELKMSAGAMQYFAEKFASSNLPENIKIACVHMPSDEKNPYGAIVMKNRGINIDDFSDRDQAIQWLSAT